MIGATVNTRQLVAWAKIWDHRLSWIACLDVAGDPLGTRRNWQRMVDAGVPGVATIHVGDEPSEMDWYVEQGVDFLGLGGMAGSRTPPAVQFRWLVSVFKYAEENHPQMRFHGWGITKPAWMRLPFFSVDSSGWGASYRYGRITLRHPLTGRQVGVDLNGRGTYKPDIALLLRDHYGVNPSEISRSVPDNRLLLVKLSALSASVQEQQIRRLHRNKLVTPPQWGRLRGWQLPEGPNQHLALGGCGAGIRETKVIQELNGPHLHLVDGHSQHIQWVADLARGEL